MKIIIPEGSGFCPGVIAAEKKLLELRENYNGIIYILGMFIHNKEYGNFLKSKNIISAEDFNKIENGSVLVISTHGIDRNFENNLKTRLKVFDFTCPKVKNVQKIIFSHKDYLTIITGKENHPETIGLKSYSSKNIVISDLAQLDKKKFIQQIKDKKILLISQTTANENLYVDTLNYLDNLLKNNFIIELKNYNTICPSIVNRENNSIDLLGKYNIKAIVIGDKLSSNSQRLFLMLKKVKEDIYFIENKSDLMKILDKIEKEKEILVVSSSSTPSFVEKEITDFLTKI